MFFFQGDDSIKMYKSKEFRFGITFSYLPLLKSFWNEHMFWPFIIIWFETIKCFGLLSSFVLKQTSSWLKGFWLMTKWCFENSHTGRKWQVFSWQSVSKHYLVSSNFTIFEEFVCQTFSLSKVSYIQYFTRHYWKFVWNEILL